MRLLELFARLDELTQRIYTKRAGNTLGVFARARSPFPTLVFYPHEGDVKSSDNFTVARAQPGKMEKEYKALQKKKYITRDITPQEDKYLQVLEAFGTLVIGAEDVGELAEIFGLPVKAAQYNRVGLYKLITTDLGKSAEFFVHLFGEKPEMGEGDFVPFHNARLFVPENMSQRGKDNASAVLENVHGKLAAVGEEETFSGDIHFTNQLPSRVGGVYDISHKDIKINSKIKKSNDNVFALLHEYGHKRMYENMSQEQRAKVEQMYSDLRSGGEQHMPDLDYVTAVHELVGQLRPGMQAQYVGRKRKKHKDVEVKDIQMYKGNQAVVLVEPGTNRTVDMSYVHNFLNPKQWRIPELGDERPVAKENWQTQTEEWFPTKYSETNSDEWWAELYAFYTHGNLSGEPANWIKNVLQGAATETVGSNTGEVNSDDDVPWPGPAHGDEEGNASWDWTDPYHSSGEENAVVSNRP